jgi:hypothetical protein
MKKQWLKMGRMVAMLAAAITLQTQYAEAQILKKITQKVAEKVENEANKRLDKKIDQAVNKGLDKVEQSAEEALKAKSEKEVGQSLAEMMAKLSLGEPAKKEQYQFDMGIAYEMYSKSDEEEFSNQSVIWYAQSGDLGIEAEQSGNIITSVFNEEQLLLFMENDKKYMALGAGMAEGLAGMVGDNVNEGASETLTSDEAKSFKITQLANDNVLGYTCKVFLIENPDQEAKIWITEELNLNFASMLNNKFGGMTQQSAFNVLPKELKNMNGVLLKMESKEKINGQYTKLEAKKIHESGRTIRIADYTFSGM